jgi:hypothetical protein
VQTAIMEARRSLPVLLLSLLGALLLTSCFYQSKWPLKVSFHGISYEFPRSHIEAAVVPPDGHLYVRLEPTGTNFHLVLDEWIDLPSPHGPSVPRISRLSDNRFGKFAVTPSRDGPIVCDRGPQPHFNCGILVADGPVKWSVLFDRAYVAQASQIRTRAIAAIRSYRKNDE